MCGITGFAGINDRNILEKMNSIQAHRGPDDEGYYIETNQSVSIAMRRLSIIDLQDGHQPMSNVDETIWIVFNGEIFNAPQLRTSLLQKGYLFKTDHSDTEVLICMYEHYKEKMVQHLNGMFAFCIYDKKQNKLFAARDPFGIKPFYYSLEKNIFSFASEVKSLLKCPWITKDLNKQAISHYFTFQTVPSPFSIFNSIKKLPAGNSLQYDLGSKKVTTIKYWSPSFSSSVNLLNSKKNGEIKETIRNLFFEAVKRWSQSDVEIACSLSGGIDSSSVIAALSLQGYNNIKTFTLGFSDQPDLDEKYIAQHVAKKWNTEHHEIIIDASDFLKSLDKMIYHLDEPYAGGLPSWFVFEGMHKYVKVAMTGTGGDELFGNYGKWKYYKSHRDHFYKLREYLKNGGKIKHALKYPNGCLHYPYFSDGVKETKLFTRDFSHALAPSAETIQNLWLSKKYSVEDAVANVDIQLQLPEEFLLMTDRFSMAFSLEARTPFLDKEFAEFIFSIPAVLRTSNKSLKYLFVESVKDLLPDEVLKGPKKGFVLPQSTWLKNELKETVEDLSDRKFLTDQGIFQSDLIEKLLMPYFEGKHNRDWELWNYLMFQMWYQNIFKTIKNENSTS